MVSFNEISLGDGVSRTKHDKRKSATTTLSHRIYLYWRYSTPNPANHLSSSSMYPRKKSCATILILPHRGLTLLERSSATALIYNFRLLNLLNLLLFLIKILSLKSKRKLNTTAELACPKSCYRRFWLELPRFAMDDFLK